MSLLKFFLREAPPPSKKPRISSDNDGDRTDDSSSESDSESVSVMVTDSGPSTATSESELSSKSHSSSGGSHKQASGFKKEWLKVRTNQKSPTFAHAAWYLWQPSIIQYFMYYDK